MKTTTVFLALTKSPNRILFPCSSTTSSRLASNSDRIVGGVLSSNTAASALRLALLSLRFSFGNLRLLARSATSSCSSTDHVAPVEAELKGHVGGVVESEVDGLGI
jgi:hypothetical protein